MRKNILTSLTILIFTLLICTTSFAKEPIHQQSTTEKNQITMRDSLETYLNNIEEYSIIDSNYTKHNTICLTTNVFPMRFGFPVKQTTFYFYKNKVAKATFEFQNPQDKENILQQCKLRYERSFTRPQHNKNSQNESYYFEEYSWETIEGFIILYYSKQPGIGKRLTFSITTKYVIDDKNYFNSEIDKKYFSI